MSRWMPFGHLAREEDAGHDAAVGKLHRPAIEAGRLTGLDSRPDVIGHVVELARHGDPALRHLEHARDGRPRSSRSDSAGAVMNSPRKVAPSRFALSFRPRISVPFTKSWVDMGLLGERAGADGLGPSAPAVPAA